MDAVNDMFALARSIKAEAARAGFDACRIASASDEADNGFDAWLGRGWHADMAWLAHSRDMRRRVALLLPGAQAVIVLARYYYRRDIRPAPGAAIARYAWSRDYHRALKQPLRTLVAHIQAQAPEAQCYASTDSGPVRERAWAARAGLGWIGRHGLVIHPCFGTWFFLATIVTSLPLPADPPQSDRCGDCDACIRACPTAAIGEERLVDARRCIAYHTIENKGVIPGEIASKRQGWVFGCDICQEACPWNRPEHVAEDAAMSVRQEFACLDADRLHRLDAQGFRRLFAGTPVMRAKHIVGRR